MLKTTLECEKKQNLVKSSSAATNEDRFAASSIVLLLVVVETFSCKSSLTVDAVAFSDTIIAIS